MADFNDMTITPDIPDIVEWAQANFYIVETRRPIALLPHQQDILRLFSQRRADGRFCWTTCLYSTIKKSGKTTISALYARWAAETWGPYQEVYNLGNKLKQAKERAFTKIRQSIKLAPPPIRAEWDIRAMQMRHLPSESLIQALPVSDAGEAGANPSLTVWTELWGFEYEAALRFWDEFQPVSTRPLSQRFVDTYAGYAGESKLLQSLWDMALSGERLHDTLPVYGVESAGLIAYIDAGLEARRMPWQQGEAGRRYYAEREANERPLNFRRLHLNEWVDSQTALVALPVWDRLQSPPLTPPQGIGEGARFAPPAGRGEMAPVVIGVDASVSGDSTALTAVTLDGERVVELATQVFEPPPGGKLDYDATLRPALEDLLNRYPVVCVAYDEYQLHSFMGRLQKAYPRIEFYAFPQGKERKKADTALLNRLHQGALRHSGNLKLREHIQHADAKEDHDGTAIRIVKRDASQKIDAVVALSMAAWKVSQTEATPRRSLARAGARGLYEQG